MKGLKIVYYFSNYGEVLCKKESSRKLLRDINRELNCGELVAHSHFSEILLLFL